MPSTRWSTDEARRSPVHRRRVGASRRCRACASAPGRYATGRVGGGGLRRDDVGRGHGTVSCLALARGARPPARRQWGRHGQGAADLRETSAHGLDDFAPAAAAGRRLIARRDHAVRVMTAHPIGGDPGHSNRVHTRAKRGPDEFRQPSQPTRRPGVVAAIPHRCLAHRRDPRVVLLGRVPGSAPLDALARIRRLPGGGRRRGGGRETHCRPRRADGGLTAVDATTTRRSRAGGDFWIGGS